MKKTSLLPTLTRFVCNLPVVPALLAALAFGALSARAAVAEAWVHRYNNVVSNSTDQAFKVVRDSAGDVIVTGTTDDGITGPDMLTIKYSGADGAVLWQKRYNGPGNNYSEAGSLAVDGSRNVVVTGSSYGSANYDSYTAKYAADGALLWEQRQNRRAGGLAFASAVAVDGAGNVVVTGTSYGSTSYDYYTVKYAAADGALLWEQRYDGPANKTDEAGSLTVDGSGNVVVTGTSVGSGGNDDYYTAKYAAADGALLWERRYNSPANSTDQAGPVAVDASGNVAVTGTSFNGANSNSNSDYYTAKYAAADGALLWERRYNGPGNGSDFASALAVDSSGNVVVAGSSVGSGFTYDYHTAKYAASDGKLLWEKRHTGSAKNSYDEARALAVDGSGNVVVTGFSGVVMSENGGQLVSDYYTAKYAAADGALLWEKRYNGPANRDDRAQAVAVDDSGNVVIAGFSDYDYYTAKYAVVDGAVLWEQHYNGLAHGDAQAQAVAVDGSGTVVVTGSAKNGPPNFDNDYYTAKYAAADGTLLWEQRYNGPAKRDDLARAVAVDDSGNVIVAGSSYSPFNQTDESPQHWDFYTVKYAAANGALLWDRRYNAGQNGQARAVVVDGGGNVVVTGSTGVGGGAIGFFFSFYTAKYAAADGALLWEQNYGGGGSGEGDSRGPVAMALDGKGNVVVTGTSSSDCYTAKYAATDGALLWEKRYHGPANKGDYASAMAVDGSGNVVVTGRSYNGSDYDRYMARYAAADGALLWEKRYNAPFSDTPFIKEAVALDGSGNVVVAGSFAYYLAKYAASDGTLLWEKQTHDGGQGLALDGSGNVVVIGSNYDQADSYYTAKYAAADGALLWEKRYHGPANGDHHASSLALGSNGMVAVAGSSGGDYATVVYRETLPPVSVDLVPAGIRLRFTGVPGYSYNVERAPGVTGPWTSIDTQAAPASGLLEYLDEPPSAAVFYRTSAP